MLSKRLTFRAVALALALCGPLHAAELGEVKVNSHIGQQLSADIELVDLTAADLAELQARLANPDVFKGAGLEMPPELGGLNIAIARRDNKRILHLTTLQPIKAEAVHLFLELSAGGRQVIRAASLWLTPEPAPQRTARAAEAPLALPSAPAPVAAVNATTPQAPATAPQASGEAGLNEAAQRAFAYRKQKALEQAQAGAAAQEMTPASKLTPPVPAPSAFVPAATRVAAATAPPPAASARHAATPPQSCAPAKQVEAQIMQCQAMSSKLADIEGKVHHLQTAMAAPAAATAARTAASTPPAAEAKTEPANVKPAEIKAKSVSAPAKPGATPVKPGVAADLAGSSRKRLIMVVAGVLAGLAALGATIYFLRKRQSKGTLKIWQSFRKKNEADVLDASPEDAEQLAAQ